MPKENVLKSKSFDFAVRIVNLYKFLKKECNEYVFINKKIYDSLNYDCEELLRLLISSVKTTKVKPEK